MAEGTVRWYDASKGRGLISREDGGESVSVHVSAVQDIASRALRQGDRVTFELVWGQKGLEAAKVRRR